MKEVSKGSLDTTFREFLEKTGEAVALPRGGVRYLRRLTTTTHGEDAARDVFDEATATPMQRIERAKPQDLAALLMSEPVQLVAAFVSVLPAKLSAGVLQEMDAERQQEIVRAVTELKEIPTTALEEAAEAIAAVLPVSDGGTVQTIDGMSKAAQVINAADKSVQQAIESNDPELLEKVREAMFTFEDLKKLDERAMRMLLREVPAERLVLALKGAEDDLIDALLAGLSSRAAQLIRDDLDVLGYVKKPEIEAARREVVGVALRLESEGRLELPRGGGEEDG
jgi:flagellar motor switch protein FliG